MGWKPLDKQYMGDRRTRFHGECWRALDTGYAVTAVFPLFLLIRWAATFWWWLSIPSQFQRDLGHLADDHVRLAAKDQVIRDQVVEVRASWACLDAAKNEIVGLKKTLREERVLLKQYTDYCGKLPRG